MLKKKGGASSEIFEWMKQYIRSLDDNGWFVCTIYVIRYILQNSMSHCMHGCLYAVVEHGIR